MIDAFQQYASDNYAGVCPEAWAAMDLANRGHAPAYGEDPWTARAAEAFRTLFASPCEVFFAFNGTAANSMALAALCQSYHSVICAESAHVETDECGAPEFFSNGSKLLVAASPGGKLTPAAIPFLLIDEARLALRVSNAVLLAMLFITGYWWARFTLGKPWLVGSLFLIGGVALVVLAIALGG